MSGLNSSFIKGFVLRFVLPVLAPIVVGLGASVISSRMMTEQLDHRVTTLEKEVTEEKLLTRTVNLEIQIERHEKALERDFARHEQTVFELAHKTDDQEKRLTRLETLVGETQRLLSEISADVKLLLRGSKK